MSESTLQAILLLEAPKHLPDLRLFRRNVLVMKVEGRTVRAGIKGQCDLYGYFKGGQSIEIELKSATKPSTPEQKTWAAWCAEWGVLHLLLRARADETAQATVARWCAEIAAARR